MTHFLEEPLPSWIEATEMDGMGAAARSYRVFFSLYEKLEEWQGFQRFQLY